MRTLIFSVCLIFCSLATSTQTFGVVYYTYTNGGSTGLWSAAGTWTTDPSGLSLVGSAVPGNNDVVHILNGFTVTLNANVATTGLSINIHNGGTLDLSTRTIGTISSLTGQGTLRIGSAYFPTITTNNFTAQYAGGATVEFYNFTGSIPSGLGFPNLVFANTSATAHTISLANTSAYTLTILGNLTTQRSGTGTLRVLLGTQNGNAITLQVNGDVTIGNGTTLGVSATNSIHEIDLYGNLINNGTVDLSNGSQYATPANGAANLSFLGASDKTLACNGVTDIYSLTVNKGMSSTNILSVTSTDPANFNLYTAGQLLTITNGTLRLGANININRMYGTNQNNYDIGSTTTSPMLWIDGANVDANGSPLVVYGKFRITAGSFTTLGREGSVIREEGQYIIEGGTFTTEKFRPSTTASTHRGSFTMTGGTFNASGTSGSNNSYARFSLPYPEQVFIMSGGTINVNNPQSGGGAPNGGIHIGSNASNYSVTGGTINAILSGGATSFSISSTVPFWNLNISRTGGTPTTVYLTGIGSVANTITSAQPLVVLNDLTITGTNSPTLNANGQTVTIGRHFTIQTGATYTPGANTTIFNGAVDQTVTNNGTITTGFYALTMAKAGGALIMAGTASSYTVTNQLTLTKGVLNDGGKTIFVSGNIHSEASHTGAGRITLDGSATQTLSGNGNGIFGNVTLNNTSNPGVNATSDLTISGTLTLAGTGNSIFDIAHYQLTLSSVSATAVTTTGAGFSSSKMIRTSGFQTDRGVRKAYGDLTAFTFPFGAGTSYTPATIKINVAPTTYGAITARPVNSRHPLVVSGNTNNLRWYWKVTSTNFTGLAANAVTHTYNYVDSYVAPANDDANYVAARYSPTSWTVLNNTNTVNQGLNTISFTSVGYIDGEFTAGWPTAFGTVRIFYSKRSGNWNNVTPGATPWSLTSHTGPDANVVPVAGDHVYIGNGTTANHTITITNNNRACGGIEIASGSTLDVGSTTGHNFGTLDNPVSGNGTLRISSSGATAQFPAGDFGYFIRAGGGTVEYYTSGTSFTIPTSSSAPSNLPLISYRNLVLRPGVGSYIQLPNQDERIYGNITIQGADATGVARINSAAPRSMIINGNLLVNSGTLQFRNGTAQNFTIDGNLTVANSAVFDISGSGTAATNTLKLNGNLVNNGTLDFYNTSSYVCDVTFTGTTNTSITGTGAITDFNKIIVSKGTSQTPILDVNATSFTLSNNSSPLILQNGTFRLTSTQTVTISNGVKFLIPATARLSANGGTMQTTGADDIDLLLTGTLEILSGTVNVGTTANDNSIEYAATGQPTIRISGGALNVNSQIRRSFASSQGGLIYNQSGNSVVTVATNSALTNSRGVFEMLNPGSSFTMSGGTLRVSRPSTAGGSIAELYLQPASHNVTGGTIEVGSGNTTQTIRINSTSPVFNLSVTGSNTTGRLEHNGLTIRGSLSIMASDIFQANGFNVSIGGNLLNENTSAVTGVAVGGYQPGTSSQTTTIGSSVNNQTISGVLSNLTNFANLVINNTLASGTVALQPNTNLRINGTFTLANGTLAGGANTITALGTVSNSATHTSTGAGTLLLAGTGNQLITGNGNGKFGNVTLSNGSGATFGANQEITGTLTFVNGLLFIGPYGLNLSNTSLGAIVNANASRYILTSGNLSDAGVTKAFAASVSNGNFVYPIGVNGKYTPADYTITSGASGGRITIRPVNSKHPGATGSGTAFINYYWSVTPTGINIVSLTHRYTYVAADERGIVSNYRDARFSGGAWTIGVTAGNPNTTTRVITFTNTNLLGDYTAGEPTAFVNPTLYTSINTGSWETDATWTPDPPGTGIGPPAGSFIIINVGHQVTVGQNTKRIATLEVRGRLHLGSTTGHDFGTVTASGAGQRTIQIQSGVFPSGDFTSFTAANGGTIEYNGTVTLPTQNVYNNLSFTGAGVKTLPNADLTINGNLTISAGTVNNAVNNRNISLISGTSTFTNNGVFSMGSGAVVVAGSLTNSGASAVFNSGNGTQGLRISGNLNNSGGAIFNMASDSVGVRGTLTNAGTFNGSTGELHISGNLSNNSTFTEGPGAVEINGNFTNAGTYSTGSGVTMISGAFMNSGSATFHANTSTLTVQNNFVLNASSTFNANSSDITVSGNWNKTGTFNAGTGSVTFNSDQPRSVTGVTKFYDLNNLNGGSLTILNDIEVENLLSLSNSNIITNSQTVKLLNTSSQPIVGYGASAFIDGKASISFPNTAAESRVFPIGKGSIYRPVTIAQTAASNLPVVRVEMINTPPTGTFPTEVGVLSEARYFSIDLLSGSMVDPTVELSFNTNGIRDEDIVIAGNVKILKATAASGPWTNAGGSGVFSPAAPAGYATSEPTTIGNPTFFALGYINTALPLTLKSFDAFYNNGVVDLYWSTYSEINNAYFTIERSDAGLRFDSIGFVFGAGTSKQTLNYDFVDKRPLPNISYYRLKQTDYDGKYTYTPVVRVVNNNFEQALLILYPNPADQGEDIFIRLRADKSNTADAIITDVSGKVLFADRIDLSSDVNIQELRLNHNLSKGLYMIHVKGVGFSQTLKFSIR